MKTSRLLCYAAGFFLVSFILMALAYFWTGGRRLCVHCNKKTLELGGVSPTALVSDVRERKVDDLSDKKVVLVTGAAGFIGFHLSAALYKLSEVEVVGVDQFVATYDPQLKVDRAVELHKLGVRLFRGDVCDHAFLSLLFERFSFTHVVHLAACAGVRRSMDVPLTYLHNNVDCFLTLLHVLKDHKVSVLYASSSSTYGHASPLPFTPSSQLPPFSASSIYAATKISNEIFASTFCQQHKLKIVGLRFFTVYGPWGRPDMAIYKFAESIAKKEKVTLYNSSQTLGRDFTFISDVIDGILSALTYEPSRCGEIYNIGRGETVEVEEVIKLLEVALNTTANIIYEPLPLSDVAQTLADITQSKRAFGYSPKVNVREGVQRFVEWFLRYKKRRETEQEDSSLEKMLVMGERQVQQVRRREIENQNVQYRQRIAKLREKYKEFSQLINLEAPSELKKDKFIYYPGVKSLGNTIARLAASSTDTKHLVRQCRATEQCVAFTSMGEFKSRLQPQHMWVRSNTSEGLYLADIDVCAVDLHSCGKHEDCTYTGPAMYNCSCRSGYVKWGHGCIERYKRGVAGEVESELVLADYLDGRDWDKMIAGRDFVFFQGLDSARGDYLVVEGEGVVTLKEACLSTHHCLGFNSNGILKHSLLPPHKWRHWSPHPTSGLYVLDVDYCSMDVSRCPQFSQCHRFSPGYYKCKCHAPYTMSPDHKCVEVQPNRTSGLEDSCDGRDIHVILSLDRAALPGLLPLLRSLVTHHTPSERSLHLHFVLSGLTDVQLFQHLACYPSLPSHVILEVVELDPRLLEGLVRVYMSPDDVGNLASAGNYARFFFHRLFPSLQKAVYLDMDTVVQADIEELWQQMCLSQDLMLAAPRTHLLYDDFFSSKVQDLFKARYGKLLDLEEQTFNAGVYGINLGLWRKRDVHSEVLYWLDKQYHEPLWKFGTQPVLLLVAYKQWSKIDPLWNVNGLGWNRKLDMKLLKQAKLLHWTGKDKPWLPRGLYKELWSHYVPEACSGHGTCIDRSGGGYICDCHHGYSGPQCSNR